jgi:hypothetical protein
MVHATCRCRHRPVGRRSWCSPGRPWSGKQRGRCIGRIDASALVPRRIDRSIGRNGARTRPRSAVRRRRGRYIGGNGTAHRVAHHRGRSIGRFGTYRATRIGAFSSAKTAAASGEPRTSCGRDSDHGRISEGPPPKRRALSAAGFANRKGIFHARFPVLP